MLESLILQLSNFMLTVSLIVEADAPDYGDIFGLQGPVQAEHRLIHACCFQLKRIISRKFFDLKLPLSGQLSNIGILGQNRLAIFDRTALGRGVTDQARPRYIDW